MPYLMGIEDTLMKEAEENINDGTYIINLDTNNVLFVDNLNSLQIESKAYSSIVL